MKIGSYKHCGKPGYGFIIWFIWSHDWCSRWSTVRADYWAEIQIFLDRSFLGQASATILLLIYFHLARSFQAFLLLNIVSDYQESLFSNASQVIVPGQSKPGILILISGEFIIIIVVECFCEVLYALIDHVKRFIITIGSAWSKDDAARFLWLTILAALAWVSTVLLPFSFTRVSVLFPSPMRVIWPTWISSPRFEISFVAR